MLENIQSTLKDPKFQRSAAQAAGKVVAVIGSMVISSMLTKGIEKGIDLAMDKIHPATEVTTTTE